MLLVVTSQFKLFLHFMLKVTQRFRFDVFFVIFLLLFLLLFYCCCSCSVVIIVIVVIVIVMLCRAQPDQSGL